MNSSCWSTKSSWTFCSIQLDNRTDGGSECLSSCSAVTLCGRKWMNLVALQTEPRDTPDSYDSCLKDLRSLTVNFNRVWMSSGVSSVSTVSLQSRHSSRTDHMVPATLDTRSGRYRRLRVIACGWTFPCTCKVSFLHSSLVRKLSVPSCLWRTRRKGKQATNKETDWFTGAMVAEGCCITTKTFGASTIRLAAT
jgi:hypothetical protein